MAFPALRADLVRVDDGGLHDPLFDRRIDLGPATSALVDTLDGRPVDAVVSALERAHGPRARIEERLRRFMLLGLLEEALPATVASLRRVRAGEPLPHAVLEGSRFGCQGSGACCRDHRLGPLSDEDVARLPDPDAVVVLRRDDGEARYLRQVDGRCRYLGDDDRCGLHVRFGAEAKPGFCRLYPFDALTTLDGLKVYDRGTCATFAVSARSGPTIAAQVPALASLLPRSALYHPVVAMSDRVLADYGCFLVFVRAAVAIAGRTSAGAALAEIGLLLARTTEALATCPLVAGEPDATLKAILTTAGAVETSEGLEREGCEMLSVVAAELADQADDIRLAFGDRLGGDMVALVRDVDRAAAAHAEATPVREPRLAPEVGDILSLSLRQSLYGRRALLGDRPWPALARMVFVLFAAVCDGRRSATAAGRDLVTAEDLSRGHSLASRLVELRAAERTFLQTEDLAPTLVAAAPRLLRPSL